MNAITEIQNLINENEYLKDLCKEQAGKIKQLEKIHKESEDLLWQRRLFDESIQKVGAVLNEPEKPSLFETTARTKTFAINQDIAEHLKELGEMTSDFYKAGAYDTAADIVANYPHEIHDGLSLININGIGRGIAAKINMFLDEYFDDAESVASNEGQILEDSDDETDEDYDDVNNFSEDDESDESDESDKSDKSDSEFFVSYNPKLTDIFDKLASHEQDSHKKDAYRTAADSIHNLPFKVTCGIEISKGAKKVKGIGKSTAKIINEFLATGKVEKLEKTASTNEEIAWALEALASLEGENHGSKDSYKIRAYRNASEIIRGLDYEVTSGEELAKGPHKVEGIGKGIAKKIDEFLQTGEIGRLEELSNV
tara:strand:+ start:595 stop:1701 length:1107 start_codon:yes stop_codon:yes gene_type:complete